MKRPDVVLIHPPSVYDFRDRTTFHGPVSDVIPSSPVFEMYPVGFLTLAAFLRRQGYRVQIVNLALLMMRSRRFRPERFLARLHPALFGSGVDSGAGIDVGRRRLGDRWRHRIDLAESTSGSWLIPIWR